MKSESAASCAPLPLPASPSRRWSPHTLRSNNQSPAVSALLVGWDVLGRLSTSWLQLVLTDRPCTVGKLVEQRLAGPATIDGSRRSGSQAGSSRREAGRHSVEDLQQATITHQGGDTIILIGAGRAGQCRTTTQQTALREGSVSLK